MPYDDSPVADAPSGFSYSGNSLVANTAPSSTNYSAPGGVSIYSGFTPPTQSSNNLASSASPIALNSGGSGFIAGGGSTDTLGGGSSSSGYSGLSEAQQTKLSATADAIGANPSDLYAMMNYQTERTFDPAKVGGKDDQHLGLLQFGPNEQKKYGVSKDNTFDEQLDAAGQYLKDRGFKPGMGLPQMASIVLGGSLKPNGQPRYNARDPNGSIKQHISQIQQHFYPSAVNDDLTKAAPAVDATGVPLPTPRPFKQGDGYDDPTDAEAIKTYQKALADRGYYSDTIDGKFGPKTRAAVNAARENAGMSLNSLLDSDLQKRLSTGTAPTGAPLANIDPAMMKPKLTDAMGGGRATGEEMLAPPDSHTLATLAGQAPVAFAPPGGFSGNSLAAKALPVQGPVEDNERDWSMLNPVVQKMLNKAYGANPVEQALQGIGEAGGAVTPVVSSLPPANPAQPITGQAEASAGLAPGAEASLTANIDPASQPASLEAPLDIRPPAATIDPDQPPPGTMPALPAKPTIPAGQKREGAMERQIQFDNMYKALKPGDVYTDPFGNTRKKGASGKGYGKTSDAGGKTKVALADGEQKYFVQGKWQTIDQVEKNWDPVSTWSGGLGPNKQYLNGPWPGADKFIQMYNSGEGGRSPPGSETPMSDRGRTQVVSADSNFAPPPNDDRMAAWNSMIDTYLQDGTIDPQQHEQMINNPSDDFENRTSGMSRIPTSSTWKFGARLPDRFYQRGYRPVDQGNSNNPYKGAVRV